MFREGKKGKMESFNWIYIMLENIMMNWNFILHKTVLFLVHFRNSRIAILVFLCRLALWWCVRSSSSPYYKTPSTLCEEYVLHVETKLYGFQFHMATLGLLFIQVINRGNTVGVALSVVWGFKPLCQPCCQIHTIKCRTLTAFIQNDKSQLKIWILRTTDY